MNSDDNYIKEKKSFLREKWEIFFLKIVKKRMLEFESQNDKILFIRGKDDLKKVLNDGIENKSYRFVVISTPLNNFDNLVDFFNRINTIFNEDTHIIVNYYSNLWKFLFFITSKLGITNYFENECYFSKDIFDTFLLSTNYRVSNYIDEPLIPINIFFLTKFLYLFSNIFTFFKFFSVTKMCILRKKTTNEKNILKKSSIIIPCKNEENNIENIISEAKKLSFPKELVFIDDKSDDNTLKIIQEQKKLNPNIEIKIINGLGKGKYKAVKLGLQNASGYYSMIFDADITVDVCDLELFYEAILNNRADIVNGSRLIYKPYAGAMRKLNYIGNIFFAKLLSFIISSNVTDTLCGTKCFKTKDYKIFDEFEEKNKIYDLWGDFNILFSTSLFGLKIIDLPIRYKKREEGVTKMNRKFYFFKNMIITCAKAFYRFKLKSI